MQIKKSEWTQGHKFIQEIFVSVENTQNNDHV